MYKLLLIGAGHMGGSLLNGWINSNFRNIHVIDPNFRKKKIHQKILSNDEDTVLQSVPQTQNFKNLQNFKGFSKNSGVFNNFQKLSKNCRNFSNIQNSPIII